MQRHAWLVALGNAKAGLPPTIAQPATPGTYTYMSHTSAVYIFNLYLILSAFVVAIVQFANLAYNLVFV